MLSSQIVGDNQKVVFGVMKENNKVATMRLNKPSALNALDYDMLLAIKN
jgi:enoyl-CoA hydratase/carnithine racemase